MAEVSIQPELSPATAPRLSISIVIPFRNEEPSLSILLPEIQSAIAGIDHDFEVLLVDDVSVDGSPQVVSEFAALDPRFRLLRQPSHGGQTGGFQLGFAEAKGDYIIRMDADLQDDPKELHRFIEGDPEGERPGRRRPRPAQAQSRAPGPHIGL